MGYEGVPIETQLYLYTKDVTDSRLSKISSGFHSPPAVERQVTRLFDDHHSPRCHTLLVVIIMNDNEDTDGYPNAMLLYLQPPEMTARQIKFYWSQIVVVMKGR
jgi:hypothetical protein